MFAATLPALTQPPSWSAWCLPLLIVVAGWLLLSCTGWNTPVCVQLWGCAGAWGWCGTEAKVMFLQTG